MKLSSRSKILQTEKVLEQLHWLTRLRTSLCLGCDGKHRLWAHMTLAFQLSPMRASVQNIAQGFATP